MTILIWKKLFQWCMRNPKFSGQVSRQLTYSPENLMEILQRKVVLLNKNVFWNSKTLLGNFLLFEKPLHWMVNFKQLLTIFEWVMSRIEWYRPRSYAQKYHSVSFKTSTHSLTGQSVNKIYQQISYIYSEKKPYPKTIFLKSWLNW